MLTVAAVANIPYTIAEQVSRAVEELLHFVTVC